MTETGQEQAGAEGTQQRQVPSDRRIRLTLTLFSGVLVLGLSGLFLGLTTQIFDRMTPSLRHELEWKVLAGAREIARSSEYGLVLEDGEAILNELADYTGAPEVQAVVVTSSTGKEIAHHGQLPMPSAVIFAHPAEEVVEGPGFVMAWRSVSIEGRAVGKVALVLSTQILQEGRRLRENMLAVTALGSVVALLLSLLFGRLYVGPLIGLTTRTLRELKELNLTLEQRVTERTRELKDANAKLGESLVLLQQTQAQLVEASRQSGMAEVATSVLHNVGNVLNSVNVSSSLVVESLKTSKVAGLQKAIQLLAANRGKLPEFLGSDPKGSKLPEYLERLSEVLASEIAANAAEMELLQKNIEHIKVIVAMQQSHAKAGGVLEPTDIRGLLEDAILLDGAGLSRAGLTVRKEIQALPQVLVDRHRLLQIVMNLLSNARQAVASTGVSGGMITVRATAIDGQRLAIEVEDTGCGIPTENLAKIFTHGFTTKAGGHGFGLHSSACAAVEMGARLVAQSDGPGRGARFTLTLPARQRFSATPPPVTGPADTQPHS